MNERERGHAEAAMRAEITAGCLDAARRWREVGEAVAGAADVGDAATALTSPPFSYSASVVHYVLDMPLRRLTHLARSEMVTEMDEIATYLDEDEQDG